LASLLPEGIREKVVRKLSADDFYLVADAFAQWPLKMDLYGNELVGM
jgi:hypothetical protein